MDKLDVILKSEELGGTARRNALESVLIEANRLGCQLETGGGRVGGINVRYGSIGYAIMDVNVKGHVKLYVQPHPNKPAPDELVDKLNGTIDADDSMNPKTFPLNVYGQLTEVVEDIPEESLLEYLRIAVETIRDHYYQHSYGSRSAA